MNVRHLLVVPLIAVLFLAVSCRKETAAHKAERGAAGAESQMEGPSTEESSNAVPAAGSRMPDYEAKWADGSPFRLADRKGKVVLLNVWATWCGPCRYEIPELQAMHEKLSGRGFEVIGVSIDDPGMENDVRSFVQKEKMSYPIVLDPQGKIADLFQTSVIPTTALIDRQGTIVWMHRGIVSANDQELQAALDKAL